MSDNADSNRLVNHTSCDFLWGAAEIAEAINRTPRQAQPLGASFAGGPNVKAVTVKIVPIIRF